MDKKEVVAIESEKTEPGEAGVTPEAIKSLPQSVQNLFWKLPDNTQKELTSGVDGREKTEDASPLQLIEKLAPFLNEGSRERMLKRCLANLFQETNFRKMVEERKGGDFKKEIHRFLDLLWANRGGGGNGVELYNDDYYSWFFEERKLRGQRVLEKKQEVETQKTSIEKTKKQKRLTESKVRSLGALLEELEQLEKDLEDFDAKNKNKALDTAFQNNVKQRQYREGLWTQAIGIYTEYVTPEELSTYFSEIINLFEFNKESVVVTKKPGDKVLWGQISEKLIEDSRELLNLIRDTIDGWYQKHQNDSVFTKSKDAEAKKRKIKLIEYFSALSNSYARGRARGSTDQEMLVDIRQMENTLYILAKDSEKQEQP